MSERTFRRTLAIVMVVSVVLVGCSDTPRGRPRIAKQFLGTWENVDPRFHNWWEISRGKVVNYGIALNHGKCVGHEATILNAKQIQVAFGNSGRPHLRLQDGYLLFEEGKSRAAHKRVPPQDICRNGDRYFDGAPYAKP
jgi:hypothetical protein